MERFAAVKMPTKASSGIAGLDEMTDGGLPRGRTTLLVGGAGSGKTILALQFLVHGAQACKEPGIFVSFEETPERIVANQPDSAGKSASCSEKACFSWMHSRIPMQFRREISI